MLDLDKMEITPLKYGSSLYRRERKYGCGYDYYYSSKEHPSLRMISQEVYDFLQEEWNRKSSITPPNLNDRYIFEAFNVTKGNQLAYAASQEVALRPCGTFNPYNTLVIWGGSMTGKTFLLHAIGNSIRDNHPDLNVAYIPTDMYIRRIVDWLRNGSDEDEKPFVDVDVFLLDDIQKMSGKEKTLEMFCDMCGEYHENGKQIVVSCDVHPSEIESVPQRLILRLCSGLVIDIEK